MKVEPKLFTLLQSAQRLRGGCSSEETEEQIRESRRRTQREANDIRAIPYRNVLLRNWK